jgi:hypothetical protein
VTTGTSGAGAAVGGAAAQAGTLATTGGGRLGATAAQSSLPFETAAGAGLLALILAAFVKRREIFGRFFR